jgi:hypothetical protein
MACSGSKVVNKLVDLEWSGSGEHIAQLCVPDSIHHPDSCIVDLQELVFQALCKAGEVAATKPAIYNRMFIVRPTCPSSRVRIFDGHNQAELTSCYASNNSNMHQHRLRIDTKSSLVGFDEILAKAACWKHWLNKLASSDSSETCVLAVAWYDYDLYSQLDELLYFSPSTYHVKELWMLANKELHEELPALRLATSRLNVVATRIVMESGFHQPAHFIVPDAACVADLQWLVFKRTEHSKWPTPQFASPHQVRVEIKHGATTCELSVLSYDEAPSKFPHWESMHTTLLYVSAYLDLTAASDQQATQQTTLQNPTKPSKFSHTKLKLLYEQYKATMKKSSQPSPTLTKLS